MAPSGQILAVVALGSNLGDPEATVREAMRRLQAFSDEPVSRSSLWRSSPVDCPPGSPAFVNAIVAFVPRGDETPETLLAKLQQLEIEFGRRPKVILNEPRPLDLDLIAFGNELRSTESLVLPHPRAHLRNFVLQPLNEIEPNLVLPGLRHTVSELLTRSTGDGTVTRVP